MPDVIPVGALRAIVIAAPFLLALSQQLATEYGCV